MKPSYLIVPVENGFIVMRDESGGRAAAGPRWCARTSDELAGLVKSLVDDDASFADKPTEIRAPVGRAPRDERIDDLAPLTRSLAGGVTGS